MRPLLANPKVAILMASHYSYGPESYSCENTKETVEQSLNANITRLSKEGFDVQCRVGHGNIGEDGRFSFDADKWNKLYNYEFLNRMKARKFAVLDNDDFVLTMGKEHAKSQFNYQHQKQLIDNLFKDSDRYNAQDEIALYKQDLENRANMFIDVISDPDTHVVVNSGGGSMARSLMPDLNLRIQQGYVSSPTAVFGFSDGAYLPFYFADKDPNVMLVQTPGIGDIDYLKGQGDVIISLKAVAGSCLPEQPIAADVMAVSLRTSHDHICQEGQVSPTVFNNKVVMLESASDTGWKDKIKEMIDRGFFDQAHAVVLGEFSNAITADCDHAGKTQRLPEFVGTYFDDKEKKQEVLTLLNNNDTKQSGIALLQEELYHKFSDAMKHREVHIPILQSSDGPSVFGHGSRRHTYIACGHCQITTDGQYIGKNVIAQVQESLTQRCDSNSVPATQAQRLMSDQQQIK